MARRRGERIPVYVEISGGRKYGFQTQETVHTRFKAELGQVAYNGAAGVFFGANSPKPARAIFLGDPNGTIGSFCSTKKIAELKKKEDWQVVSKSSVRSVITSGNKSRTVFVEMPGGWKYAWNLNKSEADLAGDLGFTLATGSDASDLVWGVQSPHPPRASKKTSDGRVSTFMKPQASAIDAAAAKGYSVSGVDYELIPNA